MDPPLLICSFTPPHPPPKYTLCKYSHHDVNIEVKGQNEVGLERVLRFGLQGVCSDEADIGVGVRVGNNCLADCVEVEIGDGRVVMKVPYSDVVLHEEEVVEGVLPEGIHNIKLVRGRLEMTTNEGLEVYDTAMNLENERMDSDTIVKEFQTLLEVSSLVKLYRPWLNGFITVFDNFLKPVIVEWTQNVGTKELQDALFTASAVSEFEKMHRLRVLLDAPSEDKKSILDIVKSFTKFRILNAYQIIAQNKQIYSLLAPKRHKFRGGPIRNPTLIPNTTNLIEAISDSPSAQPKYGILFVKKILKSLPTFRSLDFMQINMDNYIDPSPVYSRENTPKFEQTMSQEMHSLRRTEGSKSVKCSAGTLTATDDGNQIQFKLTYPNKSVVTISNLSKQKLIHKEAEGVPFVSGDQSPGFGAKGREGYLQIKELEAYGNFIVLVYSVSSLEKNYLLTLVCFSWTDTIRKVTNLEFDREDVDGLPDLLHLYKPKKSTLPIVIVFFRGLEYKIYKLSVNKPPVIQKCVSFVYTHNLKVLNRANYILFVDIQGYLKPILKITKYRVAESR